ncbi:MAG: ABC transporter permease [Flavobacterium sp.]|nr:MAG: ABC transporter permease [Flavobacterium sp.]
MAFFDAIVEKLRLNPKVERVSAAIGSPISRGEGWVRILQKQAGDRFRISAMQTMSDGEFFNIVKMQLIAGRFYTQDDIRDKTNFIVVNETLVNQLNFGNQVIGKKIYISGASEPSEIIGIVKDLNLPGDLEPPRFFWSIGTDYPDILLQMKPGQEFDAREMNQVAAQINRHMKVVYMKSIEQLLALQSAPLKIIVGVSSVLALLVLGLAAIGIYGVLSYSVQLQRFELGIRMAIGARPHTVFFQVLKDNLAPVIVGLLLAFTVLIGLWLWVRHTQYDFQTTSLGWLLPPVLMLLLTIATSLLSVWQIIRKPASETLRGN